MSSEIGKNINVSIFGESHGAAIGAVINGLPAGEKLDLELIREQMRRRAPGQDPSATKRREADEPEILSGVLDGFTTGAPLAAIIRNSDTRSSDYSYLNGHPRPSHADYAASVKYGGCFDIRGSGHFSGRLTAPIVFAGAACRQILARRGVTVGGHVCSIADVSDLPFDPVEITAEQLKTLNPAYFSVIDSGAKAEMARVIEAARMDADSVGGVVEVAAVGLPVGVGEPMFGGVEGTLAKIIYGIPAVKGVEFGAGFGITKMRGSNANDRYVERDGRVATATNNNGGITGGITNAMPVIVRAAFKPTPSIGKAQPTLDTNDMTERELIIRGRHDPCIVPRALPVVEAAVCIGLSDLMKEAGKL